MDIGGRSDEVRGWKLSHAAQGIQQHFESLTDSWKRDGREDEMTSSDIAAWTKMQSHQSSQSGE